MYYVLCTIYCVLCNIMDFNGHIISCHGTACHSRQRPTRQKRQREVWVPRLQHLIWWCVLDSELKHIEAPKVWLNTKIYYTKFGSLASFIVSHCGHRASRTMPCSTALRASAAVAYVWLCCWVGVLQCLRCTALFESSSQLPSYPVTHQSTSMKMKFTSIYIISHQST